MAKAQAGGRELVSASKMAAHLGFERSNLDRLVGQSVIEKRPDGLYDLNATRLRYLQHLRSERKMTPRTQADVGYQSARADLLRLRIAEKQGRLIPAEMHEQRVEQFTGLVLAELGNLPAKVAGSDLGLRRRIERAVFETRRAIAMAANAKADELGEPPLAEQVAG